MNLNAVHRLNLWCETGNGAIAAVDVHSGAMPPVETHPYACVRFPLVVQTMTYARRVSDGGYGAADRIATFEASASEDLVLAMATGGKFSLTWSAPFWRRFPFTRAARVPLEAALIIASEACSRCLNVLAYEYGLDWGYPEYGTEWQQTRTECPMCQAEVKP